MDTRILNICLSEDGYQPGWVSDELNVSRAMCLSWADPNANYYVVSQSNCSRLPEGVDWESISTNLIYKLHGWGSGLRLEGALGWGPQTYGSYLQVRSRG